VTPCARSALAAMPRSVALTLLYLYYAYIAGTTRVTRYAGLITRLVSYALLAEWESFPCYGAVAVGPVFVSGASRSSCLGGSEADV